MECNVQLLIKYSVLPRPFLQRRRLRMIKYVRGSDQKHLDTVTLFALMLRQQSRSRK